MGAWRSKLILKMERGLCSAINVGLAFMGETLREFA